MPNDKKPQVPAASSTKEHGKKPRQKQDSSEKAKKPKKETTNPDRPDVN